MLHLRTLLDGNSLCGRTDIAPVISPERTFLKNLKK